MDGISYWRDRMQNHIVQIREKIGHLTIPAFSKKDQELST